MNAHAPPTHDDSGINLADPHDARGLKTDYISLLQTLAIERYVRVSDGIAVDLGCGYGRMTERLRQLGHSPLGLDPSLRVLRHAAQANPDLQFSTGALPHLPFAADSLETIFLLSVIRVLHLMDIKQVCSDVARPLRQGGRLIIIDNVRRKDERYIDPDWYESFFASHGLELQRRVTIRASRWPIIYLIRYGLIPRAWFPRIARWELDRMARKTIVPRWQYHNVLWIFEKQ